MTRYQVFIEDIGDEGSGEGAELDTIKECWAFLEERYDEQEQTRLWWLKDREQEQVASAMHCGDIWRALCESPAVFMLWLSMCYEWEKREQAYA